MKILVTVGTTTFDTLIKYIDQNIPKEYDITLQIAEGNYTPMNFKYFRFSDNFDGFVNNSDIIITHAGAGNVYNLLEKRKKIIVVPNFERIDQHQNDLARYIEKNNFGYVAFDFEQIEEMIQNIDKIEFTNYEKTDFFGKDQILEIIVSIMNP